MDEAELHPARDEARLAFGDRLKEGEIRALVLPRRCIVAIDRVVGKTFESVDVAARREILEGSDPQVARGDAGQDRAGKAPFAIDGLSGRDGRKRPRRRDAERMHRLADQIFSQDRPERGASVAAPGERRQPRAFQLDVAALARAVDHLADQDRAPIAELGNETGELMPRIGQSDRFGAGRRRHCRKISPPDRRAQSRGLEPELLGKRMIELGSAAARRPASG